MKRRLVTFSNGTVSTVGSVTLEVKKYILSLFPDNFFKKVFIEGSLSENSMVSAEEFLKSEFPKLGISYTFDVDKGNNFGHFSMHTYNEGNIAVYNRFLPTIFENRIDDIVLKTSLTRFKINFDIKIAASSNLHLNNIYHWLQSRITVNDKRYLNAAINTKLSNDLIEVIRLSKGFKTFEELNNYLSNNQCMIERLKDSSTGKDIYSMLFESNLLFEFNGLDKEKTDKNGKVENQGLVSLSIDVSGSMPTIFYLDVKNTNLDELTPEPPDVNSLMNPLYLTFSKFIPKENLKEFPEFRRLTFEKYVTSNEDDDDYLELEDIFIEQGFSDLINNLKSIKKLNLLENVFMFKVYRDDVELPNTDYLFEFESLTLITVNAYKNYTHLVSIYVNYLELNKLIKEYVLNVKTDFLERYK